MKKTLLAVMAMVSLYSYAQQPVEGFEDPWVSPAPGLPPAPPGWVVINYHGPLYTWEQSLGNNPEQPPYGGNHAAFLQRENVAPSAGIPRDWLISPVITPQINSQISFRSRLTINDDQGSIYSIYVIPATIDPVTSVNFLPDPSYLVSTYTEFEMNPVQTEWTEKVIPIPQNLAGTDVRVALLMEGDNGDRWLIDDFTIVDGCYAPTALTVTDITATTATLGWTDNNGATQWELEVLPAYSVPTGTGIVVNDNEFVVSQMTSGAYRFYVRAVCSAETKSPWSGPFYFSTDITYNNILHGVVKYDGNGDGICNEATAVLPNTPVAVSINGVAAYTVYTNQQGEYTLYGLPDGANTLSLQVTSTMDFPDIPALEQVVTFDEEINELTISHCLPQPSPQNDMRIQMLTYGAARPGFDAIYRVYANNKGNITNDNVSAVFTFNSDRLEYVSADIPVTVAGNTISIDFGTVDVNVWKVSTIIFHVKQPPVNVGGEVLNFTAVLSEIANDVNLSDNQSVLNQTIVNSFDPNDITVHEGARIYEEQANDYLTYTIRFQNTGNGEAINIKLENTLDDLLDWETFEPIASSHNYNVKRTDNQLEFFYSHINLPHESADEPGSHGFVTYKIKPKADFGLGDIVSNTAEIYFDFNEAIITNTATTEVVSSTAGLHDNALAIARLYPNPVKDQLHVAVTQGELQSVTVYDINGRLCLSANAEVIDTNALTAGVYFVKVTTDAGNANYKVIKH